MLNRYPLISLAGGSYVICEQPSRKWIAQCPFVELDLRVEKITKVGKTATRPNSAKTERSVRCVNRENYELRAMKHEQGTSARLPHSGDFPPKG